MDAERIGFIAGVFVLVGLGVGIVGMVATDWAEAAFATEAVGDVERFGPVFVAQLYLSVTAAALVVAPVLAGVLGLFIGSRTYGTVEAAIICGAGAGSGAFAYGVVVVALVVLSQGTSADQAYAAADAIGSVGTAAVASAVVGAAAGVVGYRAG